MKTPLRRIGNSHGILLPKALLAQIGVSEDELEMSVERDAIVLRRARKPREGWADATLAANSLTSEDKEWLDADLGVDDTSW